MPNSDFEHLRQRFDGNLAAATDLSVAVTPRKFDRPSLWVPRRRPQTQLTVCRKPLRWFLMLNPHPRELYSAQACSGHRAAKASAPPLAAGLLLADEQVSAPEWIAHLLR